MLRAGDKHFRHIAEARGAILRIHHWCGGRASLISLRDAISPDGSVLTLSGFFHRKNCPSASKSGQAQGNLCISREADIRYLAVREWQEAIMPEYKVEGIRKMSRNHLHVLIKDLGQWTVSLGGQHVATSNSQSEAYQQARDKAKKLGDAVIFVHNDEGELEFEETYP